MIHRRSRIGARKAHPRHARRAARRVLAMTLTLTLSASPVVADSALQITRNREQVLISKDVGSERWAITFDPDGGQITGNVMTSSGPVFVDCSVVAATLEDLTFACFSLSACGSEPCTRDWMPFVSSVTLPLSFLRPEGSPPLTSTPAICANIAGSWSLVTSGQGVGIYADGLTIEQSGCSFQAYTSGGGVIAAGAIAGDILSISGQSSGAPCPFADAGTGRVSDTLLYATVQRRFAADCGPERHEISLLATRSPR